MKTTWRVTLMNGRRINLTTDDTFTLAFPGMNESTPQELRECVSERSLRRILERTLDWNERDTVERALCGEVRLERREA